MFLVCFDWVLNCFIDIHTWGEVFNVALHFHFVLSKIDFTMWLLIGMVNSGKWEDDKACGQGTLKYSNGDHYEGEWTDDQRNGKLRTLLSNHWKRFSWRHFLRLSEGNGKFTSSETNITYSGSWRDGLKEGVGSLFFPSGDVLTGRWKEVHTHIQHI